jgi:hypothetical protein
MNLSIQRQRPMGLKVDSGFQQRRLRSIHSPGFLSVPFSHKGAASLKKRGEPGR